MPIEIKDLVANPQTTPFSRLKYLSRASEEDVTRFFNQLFNLAALARENNNWDVVDVFLEQWEETLSLGLRPPISYDTTPWVPFTKPLSKARIATLSTGGIYIQSQPPFNTDGDWSYRVISLDTTLDQFRVAHTHYDTEGIAEDIDAVLPIHRLLELEADGIIGQAQDPTFSFMGYIPDPSGLIEATGPEVGERLKEEGVDGVVIGTT
jgi:D-proline reductase (dithiol) PrdB